MTIRAILTDIEGTTSSIAFVHEVLFPYARRRIADFVQAHEQESEVSRILASVNEETGRCLESAETIEILLQLMDEDRKVAPLKELQGMIWEAGYRSGELTAHLYEDAHRKLVKWHRASIPLYVYSSGSVHAQKLFFAHTEFGDLTSLFSGYFDTRTGSKFDWDSYRKITKSVAIAAKKILFLSDIKAELDAAREAGLKTYWLVRDQEIEVDADHRQARGFDDIKLY